MEPQTWHTLVVRLWRDGDGLKIRFLASRTGQRLSNLMVATSIESATQQFEQWLRDADPTEVPDTRENTRSDDGGTTDDETSRT